MTPAELETMKAETQEAQQKLADELEQRKKDAQAAAAALAEMQAKLDQAEIDKEEAEKRRATELDAKVAAMEMEMNQKMQEAVQRQAEILAAQQLKPPDVTDSSQPAKPETKPPTEGKADGKQGKLDAMLKAKAGPPQKKLKGNPSDTAARNE